MSDRTVRLQRVLRAPPARVYRAFVEPDALVRWIAPYGFTCRVDELDARPGGRFRMRFTNFGSGTTHAFGGEYLELVPGERLRYTDRFDDPTLPGELQVRIELRAVSCGTQLDVEQSGIPEAIPLEMCVLGWQESLAQLRRLVEPEIPG